MHKKFGLETHILFLEPMKLGLKVQVLFLKCLKLFLYIMPQPSCSINWYRYKHFLSRILCLGSYLVTFFTYVPFDITSCSTTILLWDTWVKWRIIMFESWGLLHSNFSQSDYTMSTLTLLYLWRQNKGVRHSKKKIADRALLWPNLVACTPSSVSSI